MEKSKIGMVGIGLMGLGIATNILKAGRDFSFLHHEGNQPTDELVANGAKAFETGKELAEHCVVVILCVTGSPQVEDALTKADGILAGLKKEATIIDCSTAIPDSTKKLAKLVADAGGRFVDAPMTRTPKEAMEGRLNLLVGGDKADFERVLPLLQDFAENIVHVGGVSSGHTMKLLHNYVSLGFTAVLAEASASAAKAGISPQRFIEVLAKGGGGSVVLDRLSPFISGGDPSGLRFSISNAYKDVGYYNQMTDALDAEDGVAEAVLKLFGQMVEDGEGQRLLPELIELLQN